MLVSGALSLTPSAGGDIDWGGDRGVFAGGNPVNNVIQYIDITSTSNATDFGDLIATNARGKFGNVSNTTRGVFGGGNWGTDAYTNQMEYITIASTGNGTDFGDLTTYSYITDACSNDTRGITNSMVGAGNTDTYYITIASASNTTAYGDLTTVRSGEFCNSSTRAVMMGGSSGTNDAGQDDIQYFTIASTANSINFGDLTLARHAGGATSNGSRGVQCGGYNNSGGYSMYDTIDYITIATTGNATDFGNCVTSAGYQRCATSNGPRGIIAGGNTFGWVRTNDIEYITIATTGNATNFGDLLVANDHVAALSGD